jgi:hypothetical protein
MDDSTAIYAQEGIAPVVAAPDRWLLLIHRIPPKPDYFRVKIRRRLARLGAVALKSTVYVLPATSDTLEDFQWLRREITGGGGEAIVCEAHLVEGVTDAELEELFRRDRDAEYELIAADAEKACAALGRRKLSDDTRAELETLVARFRRRLREVVELDFFGANGRALAEEAISSLSRRLSAGTSAHETRRRDRDRIASGSVWVTRRDVFVDRIGSAWLINTFIDADARFKFVAGPQYRPEPGELRFDMYESEYTHVSDRCTFEVLLERFGLGSDSALRSIAEIVHDIDVKDGKFARPEAAGLEQLLSGIVRITPTDTERLVVGGALFSSLYESFRDDGRALSFSPSRGGASSARTRRKGRRR